MPRRLRFIPEGGALVEVTTRTIQGRYLLKPSPELKKIIIGILARAAGLYPVQIHAFTFLSNHYHLLLSVEDALQLSRFMNYVNSNLAREAGRMYGWRDRFWARRYQAIVVSEEELAQVGRLHYLLSQGCKEGLVWRPAEWPGANCARALMFGTTLRGIWFDRSREYAAKLGGRRHGRYEFAQSLRLKLSPLPCWAHLSERQRGHRVSELVAQIESTTLESHERSGTSPMGVSKILDQHPHDRPQRSERAVAPGFHAATKAVRRRLNSAYEWFVRSYRDAADRLRKGDISAQFPFGSFPPGLPFASWPSELEPG
jgi:REP element-mobilizing transposase RayT